MAEHFSSLSLRVANGQELVGFSHGKVHVADLFLPDSLDVLIDLVGDLILFQNAIGCLVDRSNFVLHRRVLLLHLLSDVQGVVAALESQLHGCLGDFWLFNLLWGWRGS